MTNRLSNVTFLIVIGSNNFFIDSYHHPPSVNSNKLKIRDKYKKRDICHKKRYFNFFLEIPFLTLE